MNSFLAPPAFRNLQVDFFRGVALLIIFINHMPFNEWLLYMPSRYGFSDSAETFVFLSGFAAALAYGRCFQFAGLGMGAVRILYRCGQIYAAHLASFLLLAAICVLGNQLVAEPDYIARLNIAFFFDQTREALGSLFTLHYVPNMFDILPMYLVILLWVPVVWALSRAHVALALGVSVLVYACMWLFGWELPADPLTDRAWYFNPFAWQLMFFTGFGFGAGWLRIPGTNLGLLALSLMMVIVSIPLAHDPSLRQTVFLKELFALIGPLLDKNHLGLLRWFHFLALAYLMNRLFTWRAHWLQLALPRWIAHMGQQSLPIFLLCMSLSFIGGMVLDWAGRDNLSVAVVNLSGLGLMLLAARGLNWLDRKPWTREARPGTVHRLSEISDAPVALHGLPRIWVRQAVLLSLLVTLGASPWLLLQDARRDNEATPTVTASLSESEESSKSGEDVWLPESDDRIEWQDGV